MFSIFSKPPAASFVRIATDTRYLRFHGAMQIGLATVFYLIGKGDLPWEINVGISSLMGAIGFHNLYRHLFAQDRLRNLNRSNVFKVTLDWINERSPRPGSFFLGKGYSWNTECTQIYDQLVNMTDFDKFVEPEPASGGKVFIHNIGRDKETPKFFDLPEHTLITGATGCGKTRIIELIAAQIIDKKNTALIVVDPKGDRNLLNIIYSLAQKSGRQDDFRYFSLLHPGKSVSFDVFGDCSDGNEVAARIVSIMAESGGAQVTTDPFLSFCSLLVKATAQLLILLQKKVTTKSIHYHIATNKGFKELYDMAKEHLYLCSSPNEHKTLQEAMDEYEHRIVRHSVEHKDKMTALLLPTLSMLGTGEIGSLLSPEMASMNTQDIIDNKRIVYIYLGSMSNILLSSIVGKLFVQNIVGYIGKAYGDSAVLKDFWLMVDEFYPIVFPGYITMLAQARAAGMRMILGMQTSADIAAALGDVGMEQVYGNVSNLICMWIKEQNLAKMIADQGETNVVSEVVTRNVAAGMHKIDHLYRTGSSIRIQKEKVPRISTEMITSLPKGEFFLLTQGYFPIKMVAPLIDNPIPAGETYFDMLDPKRSVRAHKREIQDKDWSTGELPNSLIM